jgi:Carboxypeptidase regulatory-like domain
MTFCSYRPINQPSLAPLAIQSVILDSKSLSTNRRAYACGSILGALQLHIFSDQDRSDLIPPLHNRSPPIIGRSLESVGIRPPSPGSFLQGTKLLTHSKWIWSLTVAVMLTPSFASGQRTCSDGMRIDGMITDPTGAVSGAQVQAASGERTTSDATGRYTLPCIAGSSAVITAEAEGFASGTVRTRAPYINCCKSNCTIQIVVLYSAYG